MKSYENEEVINSQQRLKNLQNCCNYLLIITIPSLIYEVFHHLYYNMPGSIFERIFYALLYASFILMGKLLANNIRMIPYVHLMISLSMVHCSIDRIFFIHP